MDPFDNRLCLETCRRCGGEGAIYSGHPNDPNPRFECIRGQCDGEGVEEVEFEFYPIECEDLSPLVPA